MLNFNAAGSSIYCRTSQRAGDMISISTPTTMRSQFIDLFGKDALSETRLSLKSSSAAKIASIIRRRVLSFSPITQIEAESFAAIALQAVCVSGGDGRTRTVANGLGVKKLTRIFEYIETNLELDLSLDELAQVCGLSPIHLLHSFQEETGLSPQTYIMERRLTRARRLLHRPDPTPEKAATQAGFASIFDMRRAFHQSIGLSPEDYQWTMIS